MGQTRATPARPPRDRADQTPMPAVHLDPLSAAHQRGLCAAAQVNGQALMQLARMNDVLFGFLTRRLEQDRTTAKQLQDCKSAQAAVSLCTQFFEMAMRQYSDELGLLTSIYVDQAGKAMVDAEQEIAAITPEAPQDGAARSTVTGDVQ